MPVTRRQFIKSSAGAVSVSVMLPKLLLAQSQPNPNRRILVVIQQNGGNDGLNTVIPYTNGRYLSLRPTIGFRNTDLRTTILDDQFAFHPSLAELKTMYSEGKVAAVLGVGYPSPNLSHFSSTDILMTANTSGQGTGWLGRYADLALYGKAGLTAVSIGGSLPKAFFASKVVVPSISSFANFTYATDARYPGDRNNKINTFRANGNREYAVGSFVASVAKAGVEAEQGAVAVQGAVNSYVEGATYPQARANPLADVLKMVAQVATTIPGADIFHVSYGGFDTHSAQIGEGQDTANKLIGDHARLLGYLSQGIDVFYRDMVAHGLGDNLVIMTYSEFGRRPNENASRGSDHGTSSVMFVAGNPVKGGLYGDQPSLEATSLDRAGNQIFTTDFRSVYGTIIDKWLVDGDSKVVLNGTYPNLGFL